MKRKLLIFLTFMLIAGFSRAQVVSDFESIPLNLMLGGVDDLSTMSVVPNPDMSGINTSYYVGKFVRDKDGVPWGGFWSQLPADIDVTVNKYVHVKIWKPRISPVKFKLEGGAAGNLEAPSMAAQATTGAWEEMVFDFTTLTGTYPKVAFMPDFEDPLTLTSDIEIYFDDIILNNDPAVGSAALTTIENFEIIPLNMMYGGTTDSSYFQLVANPAPGGINPSTHVIKYSRDKDGVPWGGFYSATPVDVTTNKYMHVKVWKPRVSPIKFKIEGGLTGNYETVSSTPNTIGVWEDMVFDFSTQTGAFPIIAFMPDFEDPLTLTSDIVIYFDDIILNNDPIPAVTNAVTLNVNMAYWRDLGLFNPGTDFVDVAGTINGWDGTNSHLTTTNDSIYSIALGDYNVGDVLEFKFRINGSWNDATCEFPSGGPNRFYTVVAGANNFKGWYNNDSLCIVNFAVNMSIYKEMGIFFPATDYVDIAGNLNGWNGANHHLTTVNDSIYTITVDSLMYGSELQFKFRINGSWSDATCEFPSGGPNRVYAVPAGTSLYSVYYNDQTVGINEPSLAGKLEVYPNPTGNVLNIISTIDISNVVITNMVGQQVVSFENMVAGTKSIDVSNLNNGLYFITFTEKSGNQLTQKLIKN